MAVIVSSEIVFAAGRASLSGGTRKIDVLREGQSDGRLIRCEKESLRLGRHQKQDRVLLFRNAECHA